MAPASFPCRSQTDDESRLTTSAGRAVYAGGREKQVINPEWNRRIARLGGRDVYGKPIFRLTFGYNETLRDGMELRFPHVASQYLLLRLMPAHTWGTPLGWYAPRLDEGQWVPSYAETFREEYPASGAYEIDYAFPLGVRPSMPFIEDHIRAFNNRPKLPSIMQRRRDDFAAVEAKEQEVWQQDYENCKNANPAFYGEPMVGYGGKSGSKKAEIPTMTPGMYQKAKSILRSRVKRARQQMGARS